MPTLSEVMKKSKPDDMNVLKLAFNSPEPELFFSFQPLSVHLRIVKQISKFRCGFKELTLQ